LAHIGEYRQRNELTEIHRPMKGRPLRYFVITGDQITAALPEIRALYQDQIYTEMKALSGEDIVPLDNRQVGVNVNIMPPDGSSYRWHYDRCSVTAILYLNQVEGGHTEFYPNYRILLKPGANPRLQQGLDSLLNFAPLRGLARRMCKVEPQAGRLVVMRGNRCWHSVQPVRGRQDRINIIFSYDARDAVFPMEAGLDKYLYTDKEAAAGDPNYGK
jgi:hypothetical protein